MRTSMEVKQGNYSTEKKSKLNNKGNADNTNQVDVKELENDLNQLRRKYIDSKRERLKSQKDEKLISNKMRLLSQEEIKVSRKQQMHLHTQDNMERIKVNLLQDKEKLDWIKRNRNDQLKEKREEVGKRKSHINLTMKTWRSSLELSNKKKKNEGQRTKEEQMLIQEKIQLNKEAIKQKHQEMHDKVQMSQKAIEERRRKEDIEKKMRLKREFEEKIMNEISFKEKIDKNINDCQEESMHIVERIHFIDLSFKNSFINRKDPLSNSNNNNRHSSHTRSHTHYSVGSSASKKIS